MKIDRFNLFGIIFLIILAVVVVGMFRFCSKLVKSEIHNGNKAEVKKFDLVFGVQYNTEERKLYNDLGDKLTNEIDSLCFSSTAILCHEENEYILIDLTNNARQKSTTHRKEVLTWFEKIEKPTKSIDALPAIYLKK